ncbi:MAG: glycosyltransferase family 2 protein [Armatimonadota bacterium]
MSDRPAQTDRSSAQQEPAGQSCAGEPTAAPVLCVIVSYNSRRCLPTCLTSLLGQRPPPLRVMVVDNASSDGSADMVEKQFPQAKLVRNRRNVGYGAAANQGIDAAMAAGIPYVFVLNPDVVLDRGALRAVVRALDESPEAAVAGPDLSGAPAEADCDAAPGEEPAPEPSRSVPWLSGCALLLRAAALKRVGAFWPGYFLYAEETDLHYRLRAAGWSLLKVPTAHAHHLGAASSRRLLGGAVVCYYQIRNAFVLAKRVCLISGGRTSVGIIRWQLGHYVTVRRLLHPTRLAAIVLGLVVGVYLFVKVKPVEVRRVRSDAAEGA